MKEKYFDFEEGDDVVECVVIKPTTELLQEAQSVYNKAFTKALASGALLSEKYTQVLIEQGLWTEEDDKKITLLHLQIKVNRSKLTKKDDTRTEAGDRAIAEEIRKAREELEELTARQSSFSSFTAEGQADDSRFQFLCSKCILDKNSRQPIFRDQEDFLATTRRELRAKGIEHFTYLVNDLDPEFLTKQPEEVFFNRFGETEEELKGADQEIINLINEIQSLEEEDQVDLETFEYAKKKKRGRPKKVAD